LLTPHSGNIISLRAFGQHVVILNDYKTCVDLLDKKSTIYSDRPSLPMLSDHMGWGNTLGMISYGDRFREYRRLLHRFMGTRNAIEVHASLQEREAHNFLRRVLQDPDNVQEHIRR
jgi:cytochrome P450